MRLFSTELYHYSNVAIMGSSKSARSNGAGVMMETGLDLSSKSVDSGAAVLPVDGSVQSSVIGLQQSLRCR